MVLGTLRTALAATGAAWRATTTGMWQTLRARIDGRNAVAFERERRATLLTVPAALPTGTRIHDRRADGSVLDIAVPAPTHIDLTIGQTPFPTTGTVPHPLPAILPPAAPALEARATPEEQ
ncbi:hypothetical protein SAMN05216252_14910 [Actinacidiphila glaucinigra]|uniref:Uncharacterized protein n=2 Tax=Actinacidiphila glaucinigra TaxID=235986 RepID=A0A239NVP2_9ACTN|nr:hypothetical protein SAMN05216252_14910 [Actinacidiphila glaucinigra]